MKLRWTESARSDLFSIRTFIAQDSAAYADAVVDRIISRAETLVDFPLSGGIVPEYIRDDIREVFVHSFRVDLSGVCNRSLNAHRDPWIAIGAGNTTHSEITNGWTEVPIGWRFEIG